MKRKERKQKQPKPKPELLQACTRRLYLWALGVWGIMMVLLTLLYALDVSQSALSRARWSTVNDNAVWERSFGELAD